MTTARPPEDDDQPPAGRTIRVPEGIAELLAEMTGRDQTQPTREDH